MIYTVCIKADLFVEVEAISAEDAVQAAIEAVDDRDHPVVVEDDHMNLPDGLIHARVWPSRMNHGPVEVTDVQFCRQHRDVRGDA